MSLKQEHSSRILLVRWQRADALRFPHWKTAARSRSETGISNPKFGVYTIYIHIHLEIWRPLMQAEMPSSTPFAIHENPLLLYPLTRHQPSITPLPINNINHLLPLLLPLQINLQHLKRAIHIRRAESANMRRHDAIWRIPQRILFRQRLGVRNIQRCAPQPAIFATVLGALFQCGDKVTLL